MFLPFVTSAWTCQIIFKVHVNVSQQCVFLQGNNVVSVAFVSFVVTQYEEGSPAAGWPCLVHRWLRQCVVDGHV